MAKDGGETSRELTDIAARLAVIAARIKNKKKTKAPNNVVLIGRAKEKKLAPD